MPFTAVTECFAFSSSLHTTLHFPSSDRMISISALFVVTDIFLKTSEISCVFVSRLTVESFAKSHPSTDIVPAKRIHPASTRAAAAASHIFAALFIMLPPFR